MAENTYGPILGRIRRAKEIKSAVIAKQMHMSPTTYSQIELGQRSARFEDMCGICRELGVSVGELAEMIEREQAKQQK